MSKRGRKTDYRPEFAAIAEKACRLGFTDQELAELLETSVRTIYRWKNENEEFCQALKAGKELADDRVERSLYERAVGYKAEAVRIFMPAGKEEPVYAPYVEHHAPDTTAAIFWLKNRKPDDWRDRREHELTGKNGGPIEVQEIILRGVRSDAND